MVNTRLSAMYEKWRNLMVKKNLIGDAAMTAVAQGGDALRYVAQQTKAICMAAVKQGGDALRYVAQQTEAICMAAVKQDGDALQYVEEKFLLLNRKK